MLGARTPAAAPALTVLLSLAAAAAPPDATAAAPAAPAAAVQAADSLTGTVRSVQEGAGLEIITGFHLALKVVYVHVDADTRVEMAGEPAEMDDLRPGQVVRVRYRQTAEGMRAETIEAVRPEGEGRRP